MSRGVNFEGQGRPTKPFDLPNINQYPGRRAKYQNINTEDLIRDSLKDLMSIPRSGTGVPKERLNKLSLEILTHFGYVKDSPNLPIIVIKDKALKAFEELK